MLHISYSATMHSGVVLSAAVLPNLMRKFGERRANTQVAFGADGAPSKALTGFCTKIGADPAAVEARADAKGVEYVWALRREPGRAAAEVWVYNSHTTAALHELGTACSVSCLPA